MSLPGIRADIPRASADVMTVPANAVRAQALMPWEGRQGLGKVRIIADMLPAFGVNMPPESVNT